MFYVIRLKTHQIIDKNDFMCYLNTQQFLFESAGRNVTKVAKIFEFYITGKYIWHDYDAYWIQIKDLLHKKIKRSFYNLSKHTKQNFNIDYIRAKNVCEIFTKPRNLCFSAFKKSDNMCLLLFFDIYTIYALSFF